MTRTPPSPLTSDKHYHRIACFGFHPSSIRLLLLAKWKQLERNTMEDYYLSEPLLGEDRIPYHHHHDRRGRRGSFLVLSSVLAAVVVVLGFCFATVWVVSFPEATLQIQQQQQQQQQHHSHSQPTLLSVVDPETKTLLIVSAHPFYETWKNSLVRTHDPHGLQELKVDKTQLLKVRDSLTVSWQEIDNVRDDDVLALYCGEHEHFLEAATIAQVRATCHFHSRGGDNCNSRWYIPNFPVTREPSCQFVLYQQNNIPVASSPLIELHRLRDAPTNVHLALGDDPTKMVIHFTTGGSATTPGGTPICMYGKSNPTTKVEGTSDTYEASDMCGAPANVTDTGKFISPGMIHTVELTNLEPNTHYTYKVGVPFGQGVAWSDIFEFKSAPVVGDGSEPYVYAVYGDQGCPSLGWGQGGVWSSHMVEQDPDIRAVHHFGDLSYAMGRAHIWDEWLTLVQGFATRIPLMVALGNHEYDHTNGGENGKDRSGLNASHGFMPKWGNFGDDSGGECGVPSVAHFRMPKSEDSNGPFWYSYDSGLVHTTVISSEHDLSPGSRQYKWLKSDLSAVNRTLTPWLVVELHRPLYLNVDCYGQNAVGIGMRYEFEDLLKDFEVDLVLSGHWHAYFRSCAGLFRSQCDNGGPTHIMVGTAGAKFHYGNLYENHWSEKNIFGKYGYGRITVSNSTNMHFEFVHVGADDGKLPGKVLDDVWFSKR